MALRVWATALIGWGLFSATAIAAPNPDGVELLIVGAQPTQPLKLRPIVGSKQQSSLIWDWQTQVNTGGQVATVPLPVIQANIVSQVQKVDANGDVHYEMRYQEIVAKEKLGSKPNQLTALFKKSIDKMSGMTANIVITPQGKSKSMKLTWPKTPGKATDKTEQDLLDKFSQSIGNLAAPLPEFPVGVGARWQQTTPITIDGLTIEQHTIYDLTDYKDGVATIQVSLEQSTPKSLPKSLPKDTSKPSLIALKQLTSKGQGTMIWHLDQPLPRTSSFNLESQVQVELADRQDAKAKASEPIAEPIAVTSQIKIEITSP